MTHKIIVACGDSSCKYRDMIKGRCTCNYLSMDKEGVCQSKELIRNSSVIPRRQLLFENVRNNG